MSNNQIGNVVYSILDLPDFIKENGSGWVLLDGKSYPDSKLSTLYHQTEVPNAQGQFIRIVDLESDESKRVDVDRSFGALIGDRQEDMFKKHDHSIDDHYHQYLGDNGLEFSYDHNKTLFPGGYSAYPYARDYVEGEGSNNLRLFTTTARKLKIDNKGGNETRPKNIILYAYIKIN